MLATWLRKVVVDSKRANNKEYYQILYYKRKHKEGHFTFNHVYCQDDICMRRV